MRGFRSTGAVFKVRQAKLDDLRRLFFEVCICRMAPCDDRLVASLRCYIASMRAVACCIVLHSEGVTDDSITFAA